MLFLITFLEMLAKPQLAIANPAPAAFVANPID